MVDTPSSQVLLVKYASFPIKSDHPLLVVREGHLFIKIYNGKPAIPSTWRIIPVGGFCFHSTKTSRGYSLDHGGFPHDFFGAYRP